MSCTKHEKGFLLIAAIVLIFIFSAAGSLLAYSYMKKGRAVADDYNAQQALYIATSGLELVKRGLKNGSVTCETITGNSLYTNASLFGGRFTAKGVKKTISGSLSSALSSTATSLNSTISTDNFLSEGLVKIDNELIGYVMSYAGYSLQNLKRGLNGTTAAAHNAGASISQDDCLISSSAAVPDFSSTNPTRLVKENIISQITGGSLGAETPVIMTASTFDLVGSAAIYNAGVTLSSPDYAGSSIQSGGDVKLNGAAATYVSNGSSGWTLSSTSSNILPDIQEYNTNITSANLYTYYFDAPLTTIYSIADHTYSKSNLSGVAGKTVWIDSDLKLTGNKTYNIGTQSQPVVLIIDGDFDTSGSTTINLYGLIYVTGNMKINGSATINGQGALAGEGEAKINGSMVLNLNPSATSSLLVVNPYTKHETNYISFLLRQYVN
jgi:hypothetical protein